MTILKFANIAMIIISAFHIGEVPYCGECYDEVRDSYKIKSYGYKPTPIFYKRSNESAVRYYGVELEIDDGGCDNDNAREILETANSCDTLMYAKTDGSLGDGMELVSHPCSINFHRSRFPWNDILQEAIELDYSSHYAETCGLHIHIGRAELGGTPEKQDEVIGRIMFFFESHWNEMVKFSRRTAKQLANWATRRSFQEEPQNSLQIGQQGEVIRHSLPTFLMMPKRNAMKDTPASTLLPRIPLKSAFSEER